MTIEEIKELINVVHETGIAELELQRGENRVRIRRSFGTPVTEYLVPSAQGQVIQQTGSILSASASSLGEVASPAAISTPDDHNQSVKSPIVGTYYDAPSPGAASFVKVGDRIEPRQTLCIIESMKLMNEIESEVAGTLVAKLVENGKAVEYGEPLFLIRPN